MKLFILLLSLILFVAPYCSLQAMELDVHKNEPFNSMQQEETPSQRKIENYLELLPREIYAELEQFIGNPGAFFWLLQDQLYKRAPIIRLQGHNDLVSALALDPENNQLLSGSVDGTKKVWDLTSKIPLETERSSLTIHSLIYAAKSKKIITYDQNGIAIYNRSADTQEHPADLRQANCLILNEPSNELICGLHNGEIKFLDLTTNTITNTLKNYLWSISALALASNKLFVGSSSGLVTLYDLSTREYDVLSQSTGNKITAMAYDSTKNHLYWTAEFTELHNNHIIKVCDLNFFYSRETTITDAQEKDEIISSIPNFPISTLILDSLNNRLISGSPRSIKIWDLATKKCIVTHFINSFVINTLGIGYTYAPKFIPIILDTKNNRLIFGSGNDIEIFNLSDPKDDRLKRSKFRVLLQKAYEYWQQQKIRKDQNFLVKSFITLKDYTLGAKPANQVLDLTQDKPLYQTFIELPATMQETIKNKIVVLLPKS